MATYVPEEGSTAVLSGYGYNGVRLFSLNIDLSMREQRAKRSQKVQYLSLIHI